MPLDELMKTLKKEYGIKVCMGNELPGLKRIPTGSLALDFHLGGGVPESRITTINGRESCAKSATAYHIIAEAQKLYPNKLTGLVSSEPVDRQWAWVNGVDLSRLIISETTDGEEGVNVYERLLGTMEFSVLVMDSLGALIPTTELDAEAEKNVLALGRAKLIKRLMMKVNARLQPDKNKRNDCACVFLNHIYDVPDQYVPYAIAGGRAVRMFSSLMMTFTKKPSAGIVWDGKEKESEKIGIEVDVKIEKDKTIGEGRPFTFKFFNQDGWNGDAHAGTYDNIDALITLARLLPEPATPILSNKGAFYYFNGELVGQGETQVWNKLNQTPELYQSILKKVKENALKNGF